MCGRAGYRIIAGDTMDYRINNQQDLKDLIGEWGFVPYFANVIPGFSIEENVRPDLWFPDTQGSTT